MKEDIRSLAASFQDKLVGIRRHLHRNPELSFAEFETSAFIKSTLDSLAIPWKPIAGTGILATITGTMPGSGLVAVRADMDALPIHETNSFEHISAKKGVMHACGHDAHMTSLLGSAMILQTLRGQFAGSVRLIFQPAEEKLPGGALSVLNGQGLQNPTPNAMFGQHVMPSLPAGKIALRGGQHMASMDEITMTIRGKGGHGAQPHLNTDPVVIAAHVIIALQQVVSRMANPGIPTVLSFGKLIADGAINVIPDHVYMEGTFRTMDEKWRDDAHAVIRKMATSITESMGGRCEINITKGYPCLVNDVNLAAKVRRAAIDYLGADNVTEAELWMAAEDFAYYTHVVPSCFYLLGVGNVGRNIGSALHTSTFDIDETALSVGAGLMAWLAVSELSAVSPSR